MRKARDIVPELKARVAAELPEPNQQWKPSTTGGKEPENTSLLSRFCFADLPISDRSLDGIKRCKLDHLTKIQAASIPHALAGRDLLGEAPTGSGKTLCFLIPVLENLFREFWSPEDGVGALILTPTRELSQQIFDVLALFKAHDFGAMAVYGGKRALKEQRMIQKCQILIGTPGRVKEHLETTASLNCDNLKMLILDEADKLIEHGFLNDLQAIADNLPSPDRRQTLLFSATLPASVRTLTKQFCRPEVEYVSVCSAAQGVTPTQLTQTYCIVTLPDKLSAVFSFLCRNFRQKIIVFVSSVKQARLLYEAFTAMKTGARILETHAGHDMSKRLQTFDEFSSRRAAITLIATDLVGRGIDFPAVDWVIQMDCPPDVETYIHRTGRTARGVEAKGHSVLLLLPSEVEFVKRIKEKRIDIKQVKIKPNAAFSVTGRLRSLCAQRPEVKHLAVRAFQTYYKSQYIMSDKQVFKFKSVYEARDEYAASLGLPVTPDLDFDCSFVKAKDEVALGGVDKELSASSQKNKSKLQRLKEKIAAKKELKQSLAEATADVLSSDDETKSKLSKREKRRQKVQELRQAKTQELAADDDILVTVQEAKTGDDGDDDETKWRDSEALQRALAKKRLVIRADGTAKLKGAAALVKTKHVFFDDEMEGHDASSFAGVVAAMAKTAEDEEKDEEEESLLEGRDTSNMTEREKFVLKMQARVAKQKKEAKEAERIRRKEQRRLEKEKEKARKAAQSETTEFGVVMGDDDETPTNDIMADAMTPRAGFDDLDEIGKKKRRIEKARRAESEVEETVEDLEAAALRSMGIM